MPRVLPRLLAALLLLSGIASAHADERILDYRIAVDVRADASLEVTEDITLRAEGTQVRRGITRDFPTRYRDRYGNAVVVEEQMLKMAESRMAYDAAIGLYQKSLAMLRLATKPPGR